MLSPRDYLQVREAAQILRVSEQTLRNWDRSGKLQARRHPINGYRLYKISDLHALLGQMSPRPPLAGDEAQLPLDLREASDLSDLRSGDDDLPTYLPPCHWSAEVALDPKHRIQLWDSPASTVRRDWRKYPQEAHVLHRSGRAYRRLTPEEIALLQGFPRELVQIAGLTNRQKIAAIGDAVAAPLARSLLTAVDHLWNWNNKTALEICAGIGGLAEGAAAIGLEHRALVDTSAICCKLLQNGRPWDPSVVHNEDVRTFDYTSYRARIGLLSGGPPCQPWSQSGLRLGQNDERDLLGHLDEIIVKVEPEVFIFENVPGLASPANHLYLEHIINRLRKPGNGLSYGVLVGKLNAADYGVPQIRNRIFIMGFRNQPSAFAGRCFAELERLATHIDPTLPRNGKRPWRTVGDALGISHQTNGWRRWIGSSE